MAHLIDKDALEEKIEKRIAILKIECDRSRNPQFTLIGKVAGLESCLSIINTLEVKDADSIWHTVSESDLPRVGELICAILGQKKAYGAYIVSGVYRENKFYGEVCNGYDNLIEKGDKWCYLSDLLVSIDEVKEVDLMIHTIIAECCDWLAVHTELNHEQIEDCRNLMLTVKDEQLKAKQW